jgi:repressor LexA
MANRLTARQTRVLTFIKDYIRANGQAPYIREIAAHTQQSFMGAYQTVEALENKGFIERRLYQHRGIEVLR